MDNGLGKHVIVDLYGCPFELLDDEKLILETFKKAVKEAKMTLLNLSSHKFEPQGVTALAMLSESHLSIHTFPERGIATVDAYTCGDEGDPIVAMQVIVEVLKPERKNVVYIPRGIEI